MFHPSAPVSFEQAFKRAFRSGRRKLLGHVVRKKTVSSLTFFFRAFCFDSAFRGACFEEVFAAPTAVLPEGEALALIVWAVPLVLPGPVLVYNLFCLVFRALRNRFAARERFLLIFCPACKKNAWPLRPSSFIFISNSSGLLSGSVILSRLSFWGAILLVIPLHGEPCVYI